MLIILGNPEREATEELEADFEAMVRSLKLNAEDTPFAVRPSKEDGGLEGVYGYVKNTYSPSGLGGVDARPEYRIVAFNPSGIFSRELPDHEADISTHCQVNPANCGTYRLVGGGLFSNPSKIEFNQIVNGYGMFERETEAFSRKDGSLEIGEVEYKPLPPLPRDTRLHGTWSYSRAFGSNIGTSSNMIASEGTFTFTPEGTFVRTGWSGLISSHDTAGVVSSNDRPLERGRYEIEGYQLILKGQDNRTERLTFLRPFSDEVLVINGSNYLKREEDKDIPAEVTQDLPPILRKFMETVDKASKSEASVAALFQELQTIIQQTFENGKYVEAMTMQKILASLTETVETKLFGKPGIQTAGAFSNIAWYGLFARQFDEALNAVDRAIAITPQEMSVAINRAHALMFLGRADEAQAAYLEHKGKTIGDHGTWDEAMIADFAEFEKHGLHHEQMAKIQDLLKTATAIK